MEIRLRLASAALAVALLGACASSPERQGYAPIDVARTHAVSPGMSTATLREALGPPAERQTYPNLHEQVWSWRYRSLHGEAMMFNAHLDAEGLTVRHTSTTPELAVSREGMN